MLTGRVATATIALWQGFAACENAAEVLRAFGTDDAAVDSVASNNLALVRKVLARYKLPERGLGALLGSVALAEAASSATLLYGALARGDRARRSRRIGFAVALAVFGGFVLVEEAMHEFELEATHRGIFTMLCAATLVAERSAD